MSDTGDPSVAGGSDPKAGRFDDVVLLLRVATALVVVMSITALVIGGDIGSALARGAVGVLLTVPLLRVGWLAQRWFRRGDRRFAAVACGVLAIVAAGALLA